MSEPLGLGECPNCKSVEERSSVFFIRKRWIFTAFWEKRIEEKVSKTDFKIMRPGVCTSIDLVELDFFFASGGRCQILTAVFIKYPRKQT